MARRARRNRALGAAQARDRRAAHRRVGAARQDRGRGDRRPRARRSRAGVAVARRRPIPTCSPGSRAAPSGRRAKIPHRSARRCCPTPSRRPISPRSILQPSLPNGNGTASACRQPPAGSAMAAGSRGSIRAPARTFPRAFPISPRRSTFDGALDGELLIMRDGRVQSFNVLQQRLNRKTVSPKLLAEFPAHLRAYDLLVEGDADLRGEPFEARRTRLEAFVARRRLAAHRPVSPGAVRDLGGAGRGARRSGPCRGRPRCAGGRRRDDQAARRALSAGPAEGPVVEMEARSLRDRRSADVCAARPRQALVVLFRLYVRGVGRGRRRRRTGAGGQGLFRLHRRRARGDRPLRTAATPSTGSGRCARSPTAATRAWCSRSRSKACSNRPGTNPASPCVSRASTGCAGTSRRAMPTGWRRCRPCSTAARATAASGPAALILPAGNVVK